MYFPGQVFKCRCAGSRRLAEPSGTRQGRRATARSTMGGGSPRPRNASPSVSPFPSHHVHNRYDRIGNRLSELAAPRASPTPISPIQPEATIRSCRASSRLPEASLAAAWISATTPPETRLRPQRLPARAQAGRVRRSSNCLRPRLRPEGDGDSCHRWYDAGTGRYTQPDPLGNCRHGWRLFTMPTHSL